MSATVRIVIVAVWAAVFAACGAGAAESAPATQFVVYYPHTTFRCQTCNLIETLTRAAVEGGKLQADGGKEMEVDNSAVAALLKNGQLAFQSVNVDEPAQATLLADLKTKAKMPALAKVVAGKIVAAQPLEGAWKLISKPEAYVKYVQSETLRFMKSNP